jgi:RND family efflux transporter MFP subunit
MVVTLPVHPVAGSDGGSMVRYPVEVAARYSNLMSFRVGGKLIERRVRLGDAVKKGEVLALLDPIDAQKQLASARAALTAAEHRLVFAREQLERDEAQAAKNLIATNQLEQTQDAYSAALAGRDQAAAQLVVMRDALTYNTLVADHDGVITSENADTGQVVTAGQAVYGLAWAGDTDVVLDAAASDLGRIRIDQAARVSFHALPGQDFEARVREIAPAADPQSRTYRVKLTLLASRPVPLGMTGDAALAPLAPGAVPTDEPALGSTFTLPSTALFHSGDSPAVWVLDRHSTLELRPVTVRSYGEHSSIITAGLKDGDVVVVAGVHTVYAGEHVKAVRPLFDEQGEVAGPAPTGEDPAGAGSERAVASTRGKGVAR